MLEGSLWRDNPSDPEVDVHMEKQGITGQNDWERRVVQESEANVLVYNANIALTAANKKLR